MRDIRSCSGLWRGQWLQGSVRGTMSFRLVFRGNLVMGGGSDQSGAFTIVGEFEPESNQLHLQKQYLTLKVDYDGPWNGSFVCGPSSIHQRIFIEQGYFEIWPVDEEIVIDDLVIEDLAFEPEILSLPAPGQSG